MSLQKAFVAAYSLRAVSRNVKNFTLSCTGHWPCRVPSESLALSNLHLSRTYSYSSVCNAAGPLLCSNLRTVDEPVNKHARNDAPLCYIGRRFYNRKKTVKIPPTKPLSFDYSGDLVTSLPPLDPSEIKPGFEDIDDLIKNSNEDVKNIFSVHFGDGNERLKKRIWNILEKVKDHPTDVATLEYIIALQTVLIRNQMKHCLEFRKDKCAKVRLIIRIQGRQKRMKRLAMLDKEKYTWLCEQLQIEYVRKPEYHTHRVSKRAQRKRDARAAARALRKEKMEVLRQKVQKEKIEFEKYKKQELEDIEREMQALGLKCGDTLDSSLAALGHLEPKPKIDGRYASRRYQVLAMKFELYKNASPRERKRQASLAKKNK